MLPCCATVFPCYHLYAAYLRLLAAVVRPRTHSLLIWLSVCPRYDFIIFILIVCLNNFNEATVFSPLDLSGVTDQCFFMCNRVRSRLGLPAAQSGLPSTTRQVALLVCGAEAMPAPFFAKTFLQMI